MKNGTLPSVSWITPTLADSDDSASGSDSGPAWVDSVVKAAKESRYWKDSAVVVSGPIGADTRAGSAAVFAGISLGFRVPMLVISPYAKHSYVSHTQYEQASVLKFLEDNWKLGSLGSSEKRATSIADMFEF